VRISRGDTSILFVAVVEQAWDPVSIEVGPDGQVDWSRAVPAPSPGSLEAVELALGLGETRVFGLGLSGVDGLLRTCLAMGAAAVARAPDLPAVAEALRSLAFDLLLAPHRSGDQGAGPIGPSLAGLLDLPQATAVERLRLSGGEAVAVRRLDRGEREEVAVPLPAVVTVEPGVATPRAATPAALVAARAAAMPCLPPALRGPQAVLVGHRQPRPAPPRLAAPDPRLPAEARIAAVAGTAADARPRRLVTGSPDEVAEQIARLLTELGLPAPPR
jgi:electron transfer flavoprotein beta subunit